MSKKRQSQSLPDPIYTGAVTLEDLAALSGPVVYMFHADAPTCTGNQHYVGVADRHVPAERIKEHLAGRGARFTQYLIEQGIAFQVVTVWPGGRALEKQIKKLKNGRRLCPLCHGAGAVPREHHVQRGDPTPLQPVDDDEPF